MGIKKEEALPGAIVSIKKSPICHSEYLKNEDGSLKLDAKENLLFFEFTAQVDEKLEIIDFYKESWRSHYDIKYKRILTGEIGESSWGDFKNNCDLEVPSSVVVEKITSNASEDLALNSDEEYVIVSKNNSQLMLKETHNEKWFEQEPNLVIQDGLVFSTKVGKRKVLKNIQSLKGFLNSCSGVFNMDAIYHEENKEIKYHLHALKNMDYWLEKSVSADVNWKSIELRKYDKKTKNVSSVPVDFNCAQYIQKVVDTFNKTKQFGEGISHLTNELVTERKVESHQFIFATKFDHTKCEDVEDIPKEKDIYFDLALKEMNLKKKDVIHYNKNGFLAVAFESEEKRQEFASHYKNSEKLVTLLHVAEVLGDISKIEYEEVVEKQVKKEKDTETKPISVDDEIISKVEAKPVEIKEKVKNKSAEKDESKVSTEDCKEFLCKNFNDTQEKDWKRTSKYKNEQGEVCRIFAHPNHPKIVLVEKEGGLELEHSHKPKIGM